MMRLTIRHAEGGEVDEADESDKSKEGEEVGGSEVGDESASLPRSFSEVMRGVMSDCSDDEQPPSKVRKADSVEVVATATTPASPIHASFADTVHALCDDREADVDSVPPTPTTPTEPDCHSTEVDEASELEELSSADSLEKLELEELNAADLPEEPIAADTLEELLLGWGDSEQSDAMSDDSFDSELTVAEDPMGSPRSVVAPTIEDHVVHVRQPHWRYDDYFWRSVDTTLSQARGTTWCDLSSEIVGPPASKLLCRPTRLRTSSHPPPMRGRLGSRSSSAQCGGNNEHYTFVWRRHVIFICAFLVFLHI
jgi:hypothetical protein